MSEQQRVTRPNVARYGRAVVFYAASVLALGLLAPGVLRAQQVDIVEPRSASTLRNNNPVSLQDDDAILGGFYPSLTIAVARQGNVFRTRDDKQSDTFISISPALTYKNAIGATDLTLRYRGDYSKHDKFPDEDSTSHTLTGDLGLDVTEKLQGRVGASYTEGIEQRGTLGSRTFFGSEPDKFKEYALDGEVIYGRRENIIQLAGTVGVSRLRFVNNDQEVRDRNSDSIGGRVYYNIGPSTSLFAGIDRTNIDYIRPLPGKNLDSTETSYYLGGRWDATETLVGQASVGHTKRNFDDPAESDFSGVTYEGRVNWSPYTYSVFSLYGARSVEETTDVTSSYIRGDVLGVSWNHGLTDRWDLNAFYQMGEDDFSNGRTDKTRDYGAGVGYDFATWLSLGAQYSRSERTSTVDAGNYDDDLLMFTLTSNLGVGP